MRAIAALLLVFASGCNHVQASYVATSSTSGGTVVASSGGGVYIQGGALGALILGAMILSTVVEGQPPTLAYADARAPDMQPDRSISEQDCTKPIDFSAGNLRCK
jgi:hypothetical protein